MTNHTVRKAEADGMEYLIKALKAVWRSFEENDMLFTDLHNETQKKIFDLMHPLCYEENQKQKLFFNELKLRFENIFPDYGKILYPIYKKSYNAYLYDFDVNNQKLSIEEYYRFMRLADRIEELLTEEKIFAQDKIVIYGTKEWGKRMFDVLSKYQISIFGFADSDPGYWGKEHDGFNVFSPDQIRTLTGLRVLIASSAYKEIRQSLLRQGVSGERIVCFPFMSRCEDVDPQTETSPDKEEIKNNMIVKYYQSFILHYRYNKEYDALVNQVSKMGIFPDIDAFGEIVNEIKSRVEYSYIKRIFGEESTRYGHIQNLFRYAGWEDKMSTLLTPEIDHFIGSPPNYNLALVEAYNHIVPNHYRKNIIHGIKPNHPVFCIGNYIHYAESFLDENEISEMKRLNGKTLLVFPVHGTERLKIKYNMNLFAKDVIGKYGAGFDTIIACIYWNDINDELCRCFKREGVQIASAGFRGDFNFLPRLKSIIALSDAVISNGVGTNIGYCCYMNKPYRIVKEKLEYRFLHDRDKHRNKTMGEVSEKKSKVFESAFASFIPSEEEKKLQQELYDEYWSDHLIKSRMEIRAILEICKEMILGSGGNPGKLYETITSLKNEYEQSCDYMMRTKHKLLSEALI